MWYHSENKQISAFCRGSFRIERELDVFEKLCVYRLGHFGNLGQKEKKEMGEKIRQSSGLLRVACSGFGPLRLPCARSPGMGVGGDW